MLATRIGGVPVALAPAMRIAILTGLMLSTATASASTTVGIEWEFEANAGVIATTDGTPAGQKKFTSFDINDRIEEKILCTTDVTNGLPYVTITHDLEWSEGPVGAHTIEIVTGPIAYDAGIAEWNKVTKFVTHFWKTLDALCVNDYVSPYQANYTPKELSWWNSETICYVRASDIITAMNQTAGTAGVLTARANSQTGNGNDGVCGGEYSNPNHMGFFKRKAPFYVKGKWYSWPDMKSGNTQVNVAIDLADFATRPVEQLFNNRFAQRALTAVKQRLTAVDFTNVTPALRGLLVLQGYALNVRAMARTMGGEYTPGMVGDKNLYDLYPKAKLGVVYDLVKRLPAAAGDAPIRTMIDDGTLCMVATNGACGAVVDTWTNTIKSPTGDPVTVAKPIAPIANGNSYKVVMEMRFDAHPVNQAVQLLVDTTANELKLANRAGMNSALSAVGL